MKIIINFSVTIVLLLTLSNCLDAQSDKTRIKDKYDIIKITTNDERFIEYRNDVLKVVRSNKIIYYGLDLSNMVLTHAEKVGQDEDLKRYFPAWINYFHRKITMGKEVKNMFLKYGNNDIIIEASLTNVQSRYLARTSKWISFDVFNLTILDVDTIIEAYNLKEEEGIGFVIIAECFNKNKPVRTSFYYTFFDINTREILWSTKVKMAPNGAGMTGYWAGGIIDSFVVFNQKVYAPQCKNARKILEDKK